MLGNTVLFTLGLSLTAAEPVKFEMTPAVKEHCHMFRFPQWTGTRPEISNVPNRLYFNDQMEFRVPGILGTRFLVAGTQQITGDGLAYTSEKYLLDFAFPGTPAQLVSDAVWNAAVPLTVARYQAYRLLFHLLDHWEQSSEVVLNGKRFAKSGQYWQFWDDSFRLSPGRTALAILSFTGTRPANDGNLLDMFIARRFHGHAFIDIYNVKSGKKMLLLEGPYLADPEEILLTTDWITDRYFVVPLGVHNERCLICDFGGLDSGRQTLPERKP